MIRMKTALLGFIATIHAAIAAPAGLLSVESASQLALSVLKEDWAPNEVVVLDRPAFSLQYPAGWKVATSQQDYDADRLFTIEIANGDSYITIKVFVPDPNADADDLIFSIQTTLDGPMIDTYSRETFENWGSFQGKGLHLKGKIAGFLPGGARIFVTTTDGQKGLLVTELYYSDDLEEAMPGFDLVRNSFKFKQ